MRLIALRGANTVTENDAGAILAATDELMREILARNEVVPAQAAREMGLSAVPLLCAREIPVPGALPKVIRVLIHAYGTKAEHVYLGDAVKLRLDLQGAQ
jgi:chorismate mutase